MNDPRPRNNQGQFASQSIDGIDANTTSTAYNPQVIEQRKLSLIEKIRRMRGVRNGVEESVPEDQKVLSAKLRLRELASNKYKDDVGDRAKSLILAGGAGLVANSIAAGGLLGVMQASKQQGMYSSGAPYGHRDEPGFRRSAVMDRFASRKGYIPVTPDSVGLDSAKVPAAVVPKGQVAWTSPSHQGKGAFVRSAQEADFVRAHEAGHVAQNLGKNQRLLRGAFGLAPLGVASALVNKNKENDKAASAIAAAGTLAAAPVLHNEIDASVRGYKIMRKLGAGRLRSAGSFIGLPTYATVAALPGLGWAARKMRQRHEKKLSAKLRLRELARQAVQPYPYQEEEKRGGVSKLGALGLGLGVGIGGGVAGVKFLRPVVAKAVNRAARNVTKGAKDVADAAKTAIPEAAAAVKQTAADAQDAMAVGKDIGKIYQKAKPQVERGFWNVTNPVKFAKEIYGEVSPKRWATEAKRLRAAVNESRNMPPAERLAFLKKAREQVTPNPYKATRPAWAEYSAIQKLKFLSAKSSKLVEFAKQKEDGKLSVKQKVGVAAGLGAAALGASLLPASVSLAKIQAREILRGGRSRLSKVKGLQKFVRPPGVDANRGGRMVADYIDASQSALNRGVHGAAVGSVLRHAKANPGGLIAQKLGGDFKTSHYARFRAGPKSALDHWDWEVGEMINQQGKGRVNSKTGQMKKGLSPERIQKEHASMARGREGFDREWKQKMYDGGLSESEALRHVATNTKNADVQSYLDRLAMTKAKVAGGYAKMSLAAPAMVAAGGAGAYASSRQRNTEAKKK
jgi:hypothetical protein